VKHCVYSEIHTTLLVFVFHNYIDLIYLLQEIDVYESLVLTMR